MSVYTEFLYQKYKAEQEFKKSKEYKIMKITAIIGFIIAVTVPAVILLFIGA